MQFVGSYAYPYATYGPLSGSYDGTCAASWSYMGPGPGGSGKVRWWTDGTAPNRRLIVAWTGCGTVWSTGDTSINGQIQFNETTGRITMAYSGSWTAQNYSSYGYVVCVDEPNGSRFSRPTNGESSGVYAFNPSPSTDWQFDPRVNTFTGTVRYDRLVADGSGVGNTVQSNQALGGLRVELRDSTGVAVASAFSDANGSFSVRGLALAGSQVGTLAVVAQSRACVVRPDYTAPSPPSSPSSFTIATNVAFSTNKDVGTYTIGASADAGGTSRAPLHVARSIQAAYDKVKEYSADDIPELEVFHDSQSVGPTTYAKGSGVTPATMRVAGPSTSNPDAWDTGVVQRTYAHHVLSNIAGPQSTPFNTTFDGVTDDENAFAEAFGYYLAALLSGSANFYDTMSSSTATTIDLENVQPSTRPGPDVAAWVAAALYDLVDGVNEDWDQVYGLGAAGDRPIQVVDALTSAPTAMSFYLTWGQLGLPDTSGLARSFIHHGAVGDDASEPNDSATEATAFAAPGFRRSNLVLNAYDEDWFQFELPEAATALTADVSSNFPLYNVTITLELQNAAGGLLATGAMQPGGFSMRAAFTGTVPTGVYRVRVRHDTGGRLGSYIVQAYTPLEMTSDAFVPWTVNRPYNVTVTARGGVPPYTVSIEQGFNRPPGLILDSANLRVFGSPAAVGLYSFPLTIRDDGDPRNLASVTQNFVVSDVLDLRFGEFLAFALGRPAELQARFTGGTAPYQFSLGSGSVPSGLELDVATLRFLGTPDVPASTPFHVDGVDVAGSADSADAVAVVCVPFAGKSTPVDLAAGDSACGFFFDAVGGSVVSVSAKTAKKQPKRALRAVVLDPAGDEMQGLSIKAGAGKASASKFQCPVTGRYYVVLASDAGEATQLLGTLKIAPPKKAKGSEEGFGPGDAVEVAIGALAGAHVTLTAKPDKSGLALRGNVLRDPSGTFVPFQPGDVTEVGNGLVFEKDLATGGTWTFTIGARAGASGKFTWSLKITQPKGATYSAD